MAVDLSKTFAALKPVLARYVDHLRIQVETSNEFILTTRSPSPFPQHKGQPLDFAYLRLGKRYVSFHLLALDALPISNELKARMQGKTCFHFTAAPAPEAISELDLLVKTGLATWKQRGWL
jgi:hypothetical protein